MVLTVQLVPVQMLCARVALPTALVRAFKLLVEALSASPPLSAAAHAVFVAFAIVTAVATASAPFTAVGRRWRRRLSLAGARLHLLRELCLYLAQVRRVPCMH
jgi:hypothetical protein